MSMVLLFCTASRITGNEKYHASLMRCYRWFFFENDLGIFLYQQDTQGCCDGLEDYGINKNQGAESTLALFISHFAMKSLQESSEEKKEQERING